MRTVQNPEEKVFTVDTARDLKRTGNIGVTTSQQMLEAELDIVTWNLYEHISDIFIDEFCILVY